MLFSLIAIIAGIALATPTEKRAIANFYSQADGQIIKNPTSTTGLTPLTLTLGSGGTLTDQNGCICYTVVATGQLQCSSPVITQPVIQTGFSSVNGNLAQNGNTIFYECETVGGTTANYHVYNHNDGEICFQTTIPLTATTTTTTVAPQITTVSSAKVTTVTSTTAGKTTTITQTIPAVVRTITITSTAARTTIIPVSTAQTNIKTTTTPAASAKTTIITTTKAATTTAKAATTSTAPASSAPTSANLYPRLIVPVIAGQGAQGTKYSITLSSTTKTDLLFDIAATSGYKTCTLVGRFPVGGNPTSSGAYGSAQVQAELLVSNISTGTSAANQPPGQTNLGTQAAGTALNGANAVYTSFSVVAGQSYSIALIATSGSLTVFEDYNTPVTGYTLNCA